MARRTKTLTIQEDNPAYRDNGKTFLVTEMWADDGERWANRLIMALANAGEELPDSVLTSGMAGLAAIGLGPLILKSASNLQFVVLEPLLAEMMGGIEFIHAPKHPPQPIASGPNCQIEEFQTFWTLRLAWLEVHIGFSSAAASRNSETPSAARAA